MKTDRKELSENLEDYLQTISSLSSESGSARPTDIAKAMSVKKPSVTAALNALAERGYVEYEKYKPVTLTKDGEAIAKNVRRKHQLLSSFFTDVLGVEASEADIAACKMEHALKDGIMMKLVKFLKKTSTASCSGCPNKNCTCTAANCPHAVELSSLKRGEKAIVLDMSNKLGRQGTYAGMGLTIGSVVEIIRVAPLGDPVIIGVRGSEISMRKEQLDLIKVKKI